MISLGLDRKPATRRLTIDGIPAEHRARFEPSVHLVNPVIVECHPFRLLSQLLARFRALPEVVSRKLSVGPHRVEAPAPSGRESPKAESSGKNRACRGRADVAIASVPKDYGAHQENDGR